MDGGASAHLDPVGIATLVIAVLTLAATFVVPWWQSRAADTAIIDDVAQFLRERLKDAKWAPANLGVHSNLSSPSQLLSPAFMVLHTKVGEMGTPLRRLSVFPHARDLLVRLQKLSYAFPDFWAALAAMDEAVRGAAWRRNDVISLLTWRRWCKQDGLPPGGTSGFQTHTYVGQALEQLEAAYKQLIENPKVKAALETFEQQAMRVEVLFDEVMGDLSIYKYPKEPD